jgi:hypothetical protein
MSPSHGDLLPSIARQLALLGTLVVLGCRETVGPLPPGGTSFVLRSLDAKPVPVLEYENSLVRIYLAADTLVFDGWGRYADVSVRFDSTGGTVSELRQSLSGSYQLRGDTIQFRYDCPPNALCSGPPVGWWEADGSLVVAYRNGKAWSSVKRYEQVR